MPSLNSCVCDECRYLLSSALKEREMQVELRNKVAQRKQKEEEYWHQKMLQDLAKGLEEEKKKEESVRMRAQQAKAVQMAQLIRKRLTAAGIHIAPFVP